LKQNGFQSYVAQNIEDAEKRILEIIAPDEKVGIGGSVTLREMGILEKLEKRGSSNEQQKNWYKKSMFYSRVLR